MALSADETIQLEKLKLKSREGGGAKKKVIKPVGFWGSDTEIRAAVDPATDEIKTISKGFLSSFFSFFWFLNNKTI